MRNLAISYLFGLAAAGTYGVTNELVTSEQPITWWWLWGSMLSLAFLCTILLRD